MIELAGINVGGPDEQDASVRLLPRPSRFNDDGSLRPTAVYPVSTDDSKAFLALAESLDLKGRTVAEIGGGAGLLAIRCAQRGATVTVYEIDDVAREYLTANAALNGVTLDVRGRFPDEWDGTPYDVAFANLGADVPALDVAAAVYVSEDVNASAPILLTTDDTDERPVLAVAVPVEPIAKPQRLSLVDAALGLLARGDAEFGAMVAPLIRAAQEALAEEPEAEAEIAGLVARGDGAIFHRERLRAVAQNVTHWSDVWINEMTAPCGCRHEQWFTGSEGNLKTVRHHQALARCANHQRGSDLEAWQRFHNQDHLVTEMQREHEIESWYEADCIVIRAKGTGSQRRAAKPALEANARFLAGDADYYRIA